MPRNCKKELIPGEKFNKLTVSKLHHQDKRWRKHYLFLCDCGNEKVLQGSLVVSGNTKSCGCLSREIRKSKRLPNNKGVITQILLGYKRHARDRNLEFQLTFDEFSNLISKRCHYCGADLSNLKITKNFKEGFKYNGIDRVDSTIGYVSMNVVPCCSMCNIAKKDIPKQDFFNWIKRVYEFNNLTEK
jgi:hypothetical protein